MDHKDLMLSMYFYNKEEIDVMFSSGVFNELVKGYMALALDASGVEHDEVEEYVKQLDMIFDEVTAFEIRKFYKYY